MNDETALALRTLKDAGGSYLWNHNSDTIFGKPVHTSEFMPSSAPGSLPVAFGDFSHYWIVNRLPLSVRTLTERFTLQHQTGYRYSGLTERYSFAISSKQISVVVRPTSAPSVPCRMPVGM